MRQQIHIDLPQLPGNRSRARALLLDVRNTMRDCDVTIDCRQCRSDSLGVGFIDELLLNLFKVHDRDGELLTGLIPSPGPVYRLAVDNIPTALMAGQFSGAAEYYGLHVYPTRPGSLGGTLAVVIAPAGTEEPKEQTPVETGVQAFGHIMDDPVALADEHHRTRCLDNHREAECTAILMAMTIRDLLPRIERLEQRGAS